MCGIKKSYILSIILAVVLVGAGIYFSVKPSVYANGKLETAHDSYDFGQVVMSGGDVSHSFVLKNTSNEPVSLKDITTSCMCTTAFIEYNGKEAGPFGMGGHGDVVRFANVSIGPGEEALLKVVFDPAAHGPSGAGYIARKIYLNTDSSKNQRMVFDISAYVNL